MVKGRVAHIDADFLAYMVSYEKKGTEISLTDMQYNCKMSIEKFRKFSGAESVHLHLTPSTSTKGGRGALAIQKEYQATRSSDKPRQLHVMREWMGKSYNATLHLDCEADDGMSSAQWAHWTAGTPELSVIVSKDKDLRMVPGLQLDWDALQFRQAVNEVGKPNTFGFVHLDHSKSTAKLVGYGTKFFWAQMLMGDSVDNIQGLPFLCSKNVSKPKKVGPVLADMLLSDVHDDKAAFALIKQCYEETGKAVGFKHWESGVTVPWQKVMISEMQLLWMRRDRKNPDDVLTWLREVAV